MHLKNTLGVTVWVLIISWGFSAEGTPNVRVTQHGNTVNYESEGNLEVTQNTGCIRSSQLKRQYTAADLYKALQDCMVTDDYEKAAFLFAIAGVYARFDSLRVTDYSAHQAETVLRMNYLDPAPDGKKAALEKVLNEKLRDPKNLAATCGEIRRIGAPDYYPRYMIQHGLRAFSDELRDDGLVKDFDATKGFESALSAYLHCPPAK